MPSFDAVVACGTTPHLLAPLSMHTIISEQRFQVFSYYIKENSGIQKFAGSLGFLSCEQIPYRREFISPANF